MAQEFTRHIIDKVWNKGTIVEGYDESLFRKDSCGAWIVRGQHAETNSSFGWEIDHVYPQIKGGDDNLLNLRPMQWENNRSKGDDYPNFDTSVRADGNKNVKKEGHFAVNKTLQEKLSGLYDIA